MDPVTVALVAAPVIQTALFGYLVKWSRSYLESHAAKKGEIDAIEGSLEKVVRHLETQTTAVQAIEAKFSGQLWNEQERWNLKRDCYIGLVEYWSSLAEAFRIGLATSPNGHASFARRFAELVQKPETIRARALKHIVLREDIGNRVTQLEVAMASNYGDEALWREAGARPQTSDWVRYKALGVDIP